MKYYIEHDVKTKSWNVYRTKTRYEGETMLCIHKFTEQLFDKLIEAVLVFTKEPKRR